MPITARPTIESSESNTRYTFNASDNFHFTRHKGSNLCNFPAKSSIERDDSSA
jgi:hypothetical protein